MCNLCTAGEYSGESHDVTLLSDSQNYVEEEGGSTRLQCAFRCSSYTLFDFPVIWTSGLSQSRDRPVARLQLLVSVSVNAGILVPASPCDAFRRHQHRNEPFMSKRQQARRRRPHHRRATRRLGASNTRAPSLLSAGRENQVGLGLVLLDLGASVRSSR